MADKTYKLKDGTPVPRNSWILDGIQQRCDVESIVNFAVSMGDRYNPDDKFWAEVGTYFHSFAEELFCATIEKRLPAPPFVPVDHRRYVDNAIASFKSWLNVAARREFVPIAAEVECVSEVLRFGTTFDLLCKIDGKLTILDWKTGKQKERYLTQMGGILIAVEEQLGYSVEQGLVVSLSKSKIPDFDEVVMTREELDHHATIFEHARNIYALRRNK